MKQVTPISTVTEHKRLYSDLTITIDGATPASQLFSVTKPLQARLSMHNNDIGQNLKFKYQLIYVGVCKWLASCLFIGQYEYFYCFFY